MAKKTDKKKTVKKPVARKSGKKTDAKKYTVKKKPKQNQSRKKTATKAKTILANKKKAKTGMNIKQKLIIGAGIAAAIYVAFTLFFSNHFLPRTEINGYACGFKTVDQVKEMISQGCRDYELVLTGREEKEECITSEQVDLQFVDDKKVENIRDGQKGYAWIGALLTKPVYENAVTITYNEDKLTDVVNSLECLQKDNMKSPKAAYPAYKEDSGEFRIVEEEIGTLIEKDIIIEEIRNALVSDIKNLDLEEAGCYVKPAFYSTDTAVVEANEKMNKYISTELTYDFGYTNVKVEKDEIAKWLKADKDSNVVIDEDKVGDYVEWLGNNYNTCGIRRKFKTPENTTVTVSGGTYGWRIHYQKEVEQLMEDIKTGDTITREPHYRQKGYKRDANGNDLHDTYIAIGIKAQTMWYYKDGKCLLTTPVVTGNTSKKMGTPTGVYAIAYKQRDHVLRGEDYESPVEYWMPFYEYRGIGIHDASWRAADAFGKEIYKTNGSHGCVNTPTDAVKILFSIVESGTPVVVY